MPRFPRPDARYEPDFDHHHHPEPEEPWPDCAPTIHVDVFFDPTDREFPWAAEATLDAVTHGERMQAQAFWGGTSRPSWRHLWAGLVATAPDLSAALADGADVTLAVQYA